MRIGSLFQRLVAALTMSSALLSCNGEEPIFIARAGDRTIGPKDLSAAVARRPGADQRPGVYRAELDRMIDTLVIEQEAEARGLPQRSDFIARRDAIRERAHREEAKLFRTMLREELEASATATQPELEEYYARVRARFVTSRLHLRRIFVATERDAKAASARIAAGEGFEAVAGQVSTDAALRELGGDLGVLERLQIPTGLRGQALTLKQPGQVSAPFEADGGWNLLQLVSAEQGVVRRFEDVRPQLERELRRSKLSQSLRQLLDQKRAELGVEINEPLLASLSGEEAALPTRRLARPVSLARPGNAEAADGH